MTNWPEFFRILCRSRQGYRLNLSYDAAVAHPGQDGLPRVLFMLSLPEGPAMGISPLADEWAKEGAA